MNLAILIDAENVLPSHADLIFSHAASLGTITGKEIYGAASALTAWVAPVLKYAIHPNLTIKAAKGKNSSDIALVIGAMDLLIAHKPDAVIIASSDSDFSALSVRLRNAGVEVIGMGTEKANELWRAACSTFVVLQNPKPQAPAQPQKQQAAPAQPAPQQAQPRSGKAAKAAASTHAERVAVIRALIEKRLAEHGGRMQVSTLFPTLNRTAEYRADKQGSGKKPLNYLTSTYGDAFHFAEMPDGQTWVSLEGVELPEAAAESKPAADAPRADSAEPAAAEVEAIGAEAPAEADVPAAEAVDAPEAEAAEAPVTAAPAPETADAATEEAAGEGADPLALLVAAGVDEDTARQIVVIFTESENLRSAYNRLRTTFGNTAGRELYQKVKEIAGQQ